MQVLALIPARGGSKGIPRKNLRPCGGLPLVAHSIRHACGCPDVARTIISTDDEEIATVAHAYGAEVPFMRPAELADDTASTEAVMAHALDWLAREEGWEPGAVLLLQPTSPLRTPRDLGAALAQFRDEQADALLSVCENRHFLWDAETRQAINYDPQHRPRRQERRWELAENGSLYITRTATFHKHRNRLGGRIAFYEMPAWQGVEIDEPDDLALAEFHLARLRRATLDDRRRDIRLLVLDFDGVLTDGAVLVDEHGTEAVRCSRRDGQGLALLRESGVAVAIISSETSGVVRRRAAKLGIDEVHTGITDKRAVYEVLKRKHDITDRQVCACGDDVQDLPLLAAAGIGCCPADAVPTVKRIAEYVSSRNGGNGFVREVCDLLRGDS